MHTRQGIGRSGVIATIIIVLLIAGAGVYYYASTSSVPPATPSTQSTAPSSGLAASSSSSAQSTSSVVSVRTALNVEESNQPDSLDPAVTYETSGWEVVEQIYQSLVAPNGTSDTSYVGDLAQSWSVTPDGMNYTFNLRSGVTFSNGHKLNANDVWFSIYRTMVMNQAPSFILSQNLGLTHGPSGNITDAVLNSIDYANPSPANMTYMAYDNQAVQVVSPTEVVIHLGGGYNGYGPYSAFLATLTTPMAMVVDPAMVEANGGVVANTPNDWMETNAVGTGFYELVNWVQGQSVTLSKNPSYWGVSVPAAQLNDAIQPATLQTVNIYYKSASAIVADLTSGFAQVAELPSSQYNVVQQNKGLAVSILPTVFGSAEGAYFIYMDPYAFAPFQNVLVREAVSYSVDYPEIIQSVFGSLAAQWVGPVPPGFPLYNESTSSVAQYQYNPVKAAQLLAQAGYVSKLPNGTTLDANGTPFPTVNFLYDLDSPTDGQVAQILFSELQSVGININLSPLSFKEYSAVIYSTDANDTSYPFGLSYYSEDYTASIDYVGALTTTGYVGVSGYENQTVIGWETAAATALNQSAIVQNFQLITQAMQAQYVDVWFYVPYFMAVNQANVVGMIPNPAGSCAGYFMYYNTVHYSS